MEANNQPGGPSNQNGGTPPGGGDQPPAAPWYNSFQDAEVKGWLSSYGDAYPNPESLALKAWNLEKFVGAEKAGRGVVLPKSDAPADEWRNIFSKMGVPEKADGYTIPETSADDPIMASFREYAHSAKMPPVLFNDVIDWYNKEIVAKAQDSDQRQQSEWERQAESELNEVRQEWGQDYDKKTELGRRAARQFIPHESAEQLEEILLKIEGALGTGFTMRFWANIGEAVGEHGFVGGDAGHIGGGMTPEGARLRIEQLKADKAWGEKFLAGDADAKAEWARLHKIGYPEQKAS